MTTWAIIPAKPLDAAKTRLSPALAPRERAALVSPYCGGGPRLPRLAGVIKEAVHARR